MFCKNPASSRSYGGIAPVLFMKCFAAKKSRSTMQRKEYYSENLAGMRTHPVLFKIDYKGVNRVL